MDGLLSTLYGYALMLHADALAGDEVGRLSVAATGGYGRGVLAPFSDIDLLFLTADRAHARRRCGRSSSCCISCGTSA